MTLATASLVYLVLAVCSFLLTVWHFRRSQRWCLEALHAQRWEQIAPLSIEELEAYSTSEVHLALIADIERTKQRWPRCRAMCTVLFLFTLGYWGMQGTYVGGIALWHMVTTPILAPTVVVVEKPSRAPEVAVGGPAVLPLEHKLSNLMNNVMLPLLGLVVVLGFGMRVLFGWGRW